MSGIPTKYLPDTLSFSDKREQSQMIRKSRRLYKKRQYYTRKRLRSYTNRVSKHIRKARKMYTVEQITPNRKLAMATGCSLSAMRKIVNKGEGAYYSSGSRPNQTPKSWGLARLASAITGGKSAAVDYNIIRDGCSHTRKAYRLANNAKRKYGYGHSNTRKTNLFS
jgi:hypothetical protein